MNNFKNFAAAIAYAGQMMQHDSKKVHTARWQGIDITEKPEAAMREVLYFNMAVPIDYDERFLGIHKADINPNLPWADDHFLERVNGLPLNPGVQWAKWPYGHSADKFRDEHGQFNHSYMERYWPRYAGLTPKGELTPETPYIGERMRPDGHYGIRYRYGDLNDLIEQLAADPLTRQAYLPIFFPEDTGVANPDRKPCTLGYLFLMRDNKLTITYYIRSCDFVRHFRDDIYMTVRLLLWVLEQLRKKDARWNDVTPGLFRMDIGSLHMFVNDYHKLYGEFK